jgi:ribose transport system substrate-binding protein
VRQRRSRRRELRVRRREGVLVRDYGRDDPEGTTHQFWRSIHAGADKAAKELGVELIWRGPLREDDRDSQVSEVEGFISRGVSGIALAPLDEAALVGPVNDAMTQKIPS